MGDGRRCFPTAREFWCLLVIPAPALPKEDAGTGNYEQKPGLAFEAEIGARHQSKNPPLAARSTPTHRNSLLNFRGGARYIVSRPCAAVPAYPNHGLFRLASHRAPCGPHPPCPRHLVREPHGDIPAAHPAQRTFPYRFRGACHHETIHHPLRRPHAISSHARRHRGEGRRRRRPRRRPRSDLAVDLYVAPTGSDRNPGTKSAPFKTILKASTVAVPGVTIHVAPGDYPGSFLTTASGAERARLRYVSDVKWGARIVPEPNSPLVYAWGNLGDHVDIDGFDIDGMSGPVWRNGIVTRGTHNIMTNNHVHHIADTVACDNEGGSAINATYLNRGVDAKITGNVVHHIGWNGCVFIQGIYIGTTGEVKNNLAYAIGYAAIHLWHDATDVIIANNTVFGSGYGILVGSGDFYYAYRPVDNTHVSNNIVYDNTVGIAERGVHGPNNTYTNNLVYQNSYADWSMDSRPSGSIAADPQFIRYDRDGGGDYRLASTSPAIGKGSPAHAPPIDLLGAARAGGIDLGAYAYQ